MKTLYQFITCCLFGIYYVASTHEGGSFSTSGLKQIYFYIFGNDAERLFFSKKGRFLSVLVSMGLFLFVLPAWAWPPKFGAEFTFASTELLEDSIFRNLENNTRHQSDLLLSETWGRKLFQKMQELCKNRGNCRTVSSVQGGLIHYDDGFWMQVKPDQGVVEVIAEPLTREQWARVGSRVQNDLFNVAGSIGLFPHELAGGGHIHVDAAALMKDNGRLLRNIMVDFSNHPELFAGIFGPEDLDSAYPFYRLKLETRKKFGQIIELFDQGKIVSANELAQKISKLFAGAREAPGERYQALSLNRINSKNSRTYGDNKTIEIRGLRAQKNFDYFLKQITLFEKRFEYLSKLQTNPSFLDVPMPTSRASMVRAFHQYVTEAGLPWAEYEKIIFPEFRNVTVNNLSKWFCLRDFVSRIFKR